MPGVDADAILAEFARHSTPKAPRGGRRLDGAAVPTSHDVDTDAAMKWMEARIDALAVEVAAAPSAAAPSARRGAPSSSRSRPAPATGGSDIAALAQLEASMRQVNGALQAAQVRAARLREALSRAGVDDTEVELTSVPAASAPSAAPPAAVAVRSRRSSGERGTSAADLADATRRRAGLLRRQLPASKAQLEATGRECAALEERLRAAGGADVAEHEPAISRGTHPHPTALLHQLRQLDVASRAAARSSACSSARTGVHGLSAGGPPLIPLTVFSDGFMLYRGPFRQFGAATADVFAQQVMAGMVPNELQDRHPEGVGFELHDRTGATHEAAQAAAAAAHAPTTAHGGGARVSSLTDLPYGADALLAPTTADQLLQRLPSSVLRDGAVLPVRDEIAELLGRRPAAAAAAPPVDPDAVRAARLRRFGGGA